MTNKIVKATWKVSKGVSLKLAPVLSSFSQLGFHLTKKIFGSCSVFTVFDFYRAATTVVYIVAEYHTGSELSVRDNIWSLYSWIIRHKVSIGKRFRFWSFLTGQGHFVGRRLVFTNSSKTKTVTLNGRYAKSHLPRIMGDVNERSFLTYTII